MLNVDAHAARRPTHGCDRFGHINAPHDQRHGGAYSGQGARGLNTDTPAPPVTITFRPVRSTEIGEKKG